MKQEFLGKLEFFDINKIKLDSAEDGFFICLAVIFNDLKTIQIFQDLVEKQYRKPGENEISPHSGEYNGIRIFTYKTTLSILSEFFNFLKANKQILNNHIFLYKLKQITNKEYLEILQNIFDYALDKKKDSSILSKLAHIRSNVSYHYDHSSKQLPKTLYKHFEIYKAMGTKCYYSDSLKLSEMRHYYADAAVNQYMRNLLDEKDLNKVMKLHTKVTAAIHALLSVYVTDKKGGLKRVKS